MRKNTKLAIVFGALLFAFSNINSGSAIAAATSFTGSHPFKEAALIVPFSPPNCAVCLDGHR